MKLSSSGTPILLADDIHSTPVVLERIGSNQWTTAVVDPDNNNSKASEKDLQDMLARSPALLPFQHFSSVFHPSVCIGREVATKVGPIDCLFISSQGRLTIVETKLYKNSEARREVVAQLLDYCEQASHFSYDQLNESARGFAQTWFPEYKYSDLMGFVNWSLKQDSRSVEDLSDDEANEWVLEEKQFYTQVTKSIRRGEMLGLIVGDSIDKRVVSLADFAHSKPGLALELGVVELAFHRPSGQRMPLIVIPSVVEWAVPISRTVVDIRVDATGAVTVNVKSAKESEGVVIGEDSPQLASSEEFLNKAEDAIPTALEATKELLLKMQEVANTSKGDIKLGYQKVTANLYWLSDSGDWRRFFALNSSNGVARVWTDYLRRNGYTQFVAQIEDATEPLIPGIRNQKSVAIKIFDIEVESLCELVEKLGKIFTTQANSQDVE